MSRSVNEIQAEIEQINNQIKKLSQIINGNYNNTDKSEMGKLQQEAENKLMELYEELKNSQKDRNEGGSERDD